MSDLDDHLRRRTAVIVGPSSGPKWLVFDCPCRLRHRVTLNLDARRLPRWTVRALDPLTIIPSIDDNSYATACHYFISGGQVRWVSRRSH